MFIGQEKVIVRLRMWLYSGDPPNILLRGQFGSGKTTLAKWYADSLDPNYYYHMCSRDPAYPPEDSCVVVLDEIHRLFPEELWYEYPGVIVGCTTEGAPINPAFQSRFIPMWMEPYTQQELTRIVSESVGLPATLSGVIATRSRGVPRTAILIGRAFKAWVKYHRYMPESTAECEKVLDSLGIFEGGYNEHDRVYLEFLFEHGPVSLDTIAKSINRPKRLVEQEIEPFLLQKQKIKITSKGRCVI